MKKILFFAAVMGVAFTSCMNEEFIGDNSPTTSQGVDGAINFAFDVPQATRAGGETAATALSNQFIVWGEKNETEANKAIDAGADDATNSRTGHLVFPNYIVNWVDHAHSTTSNSNGWEYVGFKFDDGSATISTTAYTTYVTPNTKPVSDPAPVQTIKYWDNAASSYTFTAVSALPADISAGNVRITKTTSNLTSVYNKGYSVVVDDEADLAHLYFSDRVNMAPGTNPVTLTFRNSISQVRVGMYETVPGYDVKVTKFYYATSHAASTPAFTDMTSENTTNFVADVPNVSPASGKKSVAGTFTVKYYEQSTANDAAGITNHPTISFAPTVGTDSKITLSLGNGVYNTKLEESSATPTYDKTSGAFTTVFPQENNSTNLKLKIDYQLYNTTTGEIINLTAKTAEIPAQYLQWKPNYKYTYIFKISDNDLTPITFDAVQIEAENGNVEYITTVSEPSITTYAKASAVISDNEYKTKNNIYLAVEDGSTNPTLNLNITNKQSSANLYFVTLDDGAIQTITEASVANAIAHGTESPSGTWTVTDALSKSMVVTKTSLLSAITTIPDADSPSGIAIDINGAKFRAVPTYNKIDKDADLTEGKTYYKANTEGAESFVAGASAKADDSTYEMTATGAGTYAFEYIKYVDISSTLTAGDDLSGYYTESSGDYSAASGTFSSGTYYKQIKTYKVITVTAAP